MQREIFRFFSTFQIMTTHLGLLYWVHLEIKKPGFFQKPGF